MGLGTTGISCIKYGRGFIGIEKEPTYYQIACERLKAGVANGQNKGHD
jgi:DNA modification methylase